MSFWFVSVVPKYLNFATFSNEQEEYNKSFFQIIVKVER
jgi:hypothetical protein